MVSLAMGLGQPDVYMIEVSKKHPAMWRQEGWYIETLVGVASISGEPVGLTCQEAAASCFTQCSE